MTQYSLQTDPLSNIPLYFSMNRLRSLVRSPAALVGYRPSRWGSTSEVIAKNTLNCEWAGLVLLSHAFLRIVRISVQWRVATYCHQFYS